MEFEEMSLGDLFNLSDEIGDKYLSEEEKEERSNILLAVEEDVNEILEAE